MWFVVLIKKRAHKAATSIFVALKKEISSQSCNEVVYNTTLSTQDVFCLLLIVKDFLVDVVVSNY